MGESERERECVCERKRVSERERECVRERGRERERVCERDRVGIHNAVRETVPLYLH